MKKYTLLLVFSILSGTLFSQGTPQNPPQQPTQPQQPAQQVQPYQAAPMVVTPAKAEFPFQFGFKIAPNVSWLKPTADEYTKKGSKIGISLGLTGEYRLSPNYAICFGVNSVSTGGSLIVTRDVDTLEAVSVTRTYALRYVEFPIMLKMMTNEINKIQYFFQVGLGTSINYRSKGEDEYNGSTHNVNIDENITFLKESFLLGIGAQTRISGQTKVFGGLMFNNGFTNILKGTDKVTTNGTTKNISPAAVNNYVEINLGILF